MKENRADVSGGMAKRMASVHRNGGAHTSKDKKRKRFGGKERRDAISAQ